MDISIVIPVKDEEESLSTLYQEILAVLKPLKKSYEIIFVDDGSVDNSAEVIRKLSRKDKSVVFIQFRGNLGKSEALAAGFKQANGEVIITLDADLQDNPAEIPKLLEKINAGYDLVCGWKKKRQDPWSKVFPSRLWNFMTATLSGIGLHDFNCGLKAYKKAVTKNLVLYGELYRLIPILVAQEKFKITEIPVHHRPRRYGQSKFGANRFLKGFVDMITVIFLTKFIKKPAHFFGILGTTLFFLGFIIGLYIAYLRISIGNIGNHQPLLLAGILLMVIGVQLFSTGLLAEMLVFLNKQITENR